MKKSESIHTSFSSVNRWLAARRPFVIALVLFAALTARGVYLAQIWNSPVAWMHQWEETDMSFFDSWGKQVAAGDLLTANSTHPYPRWALEVASRYFKLFAEDRARYVEMAYESRRSPHQELWDEWYCAPCFHQGPAYPYSIAMTYKLLGSDPRGVFIWQMILGCLSAFLIYLISVRLFDDVTACLAASLYLLYAPILLYEAVMLRASPIVFVSLLLLYMMVRSARDHSPLSDFATGLAFGVAILLKKIFIPLALIQAVYLVLRPSRSGRRQLLSCVLYAVGAIALMIPLAMRNTAVGAPLLALSSVNAFASTFINSNAADSAPWQGYCISTHFAEITKVAGPNSIRAVIETLKTHDSVGSVVLLFWRKWLALWHWFEQPNNINFYYYKLHAPVLSYLPFSFLSLAPLGIAGMCIGLKRVKRLWPLYLLVAMYLGILMLGLVLSRYRLSLAAVLIPFAAFALVWLADSFCQRRWLTAVGVIIAMIGISLSTMRPLAEGRSMIRSSYYSSVYHAYYSKRAVAAITENNWDAAAELMISSLAFQPEVLSDLGPERQARNRNEAALAKLYAQVNRRIAEALRHVGKEEEAKGYERSAERLLSAL